jgi:hypothetical protein
MSNAEMPPLACGQVWVQFEIVVLLGDATPVEKLRERLICNVSTGRSARALSYDADYRDNLKRNCYRLIHGPGAPWSPKEETTDAKP